MNDLDSDDIPWDDICPSLFETPDTSVEISQEYLNQQTDNLSSYTQSNDSNSGCYSFQPNISYTSQLIFSENRSNFESNLRLQEFENKELDPHNAVEKRYRNSINSKIDELRSMLVDAGVLTAKLNKSVVLKYAIDRIKQLEMENRHLTDRLISSGLDNNGDSGVISSYSSSNPEDSICQEVFSDGTIDTIFNPTQQMNNTQKSMNNTRKRKNIASVNQDAKIKHCRKTKRTRDAHANYLVDPNFSGSDRENNRFLFCFAAMLFLFLNPVSNLYFSYDSKSSSRPIYVRENLIPEFIDSVCGNFCMKKLYQTLSWTIIHICDWGLAYISLWLSFNPKSFFFIKYVIERIYLRFKLGLLTCCLAITVAISYSADRMNPQLSTNTFLSEVNDHINYLYSKGNKNKILKEICQNLFDMNFKKSCDENVIAKQGLAIVIVLVRKFNYLVSARFNLRSIVILLSDHPLAIYKQIDKRSFFRWFMNKTTLVEKDVSEESLKSLEEDLMTHLILEILEFRLFNEHLKASKLELVIFECKKIVSPKVFVECNERRAEAGQSDLNFTSVGVYFKMLNMLKRISSKQYYSSSTYCPIPKMMLRVSKDSDSAILLKSLLIFSYAEQIISFKEMPQLSLIYLYTNEMSLIWRQLNNKPKNDLHANIIKNFFVLLNLEIEKKCIRMKSFKRDRGAYLLSMCTLNLFKLILDGLLSQNQIGPTPNPSERSIRYESYIMSIKKSIRNQSEIVKSFAANKNTGVGQCSSSVH